MGRHMKAVEKPRRGEQQRALADRADPPRLRRLILEELKIGRFLVLGDNACERSRLAAGHPEGVGRLGGSLSPAETWKTRPELKRTSPGFSATRSTWNLAQ